MIMHLMLKTKEPMNYRGLRQRVFSVKHNQLKKALDSTQTAFVVVQPSNS